VKIILGVKNENESSEARMIFLILYSLKIKDKEYAEFT